MPGIPPIPPIPPGGMPPSGAALFWDAMTSSMRRIMMAASAAEEIAWVLTRSGSTTPVCLHVGCLACIDIKAVGLLALLVRCTDLDKHVDGVKSCVLCKGARDDLKRRCKCLDSEPALPPTLAAYSRSRSESGSQVHRRRATTFLSSTTTATTRSASSICTFELVNDVLGAAVDDDGDCLGVLALLDKGHLFSGDLALFDESGMAEFVLP